VIHLQEEVLLVQAVCRNVWCVDNGSPGCKTYQVVQAWEGQKVQLMASLEEWQR